jgi:hypothetical protein
LARRLPNLGRLLDIPVATRAGAGPDTVRQVLDMTWGHPKLLELVL